MKKWVLQLAVIFAMTGLFAQAQVRQYVAESVPMAAGVSNATLTVTLGEKIGYGDSFALIDRVTVKNGSATNAVITLYAVESGVDTVVATSGTIAAGGNEVIWPEKTFTRTVIEKIVTNDIVTASSVTNTITEYRRWPVRDLKVSIQQEIGTSAAASYGFTVYGQ